ncbi:hypothetical protein QM012_005109 [Aureobasidium pullulans]|uniref:Isochorismatase-like domain-containing protein n=1 Tax=Aureobasidium pullulans TaxID=5580 RepID=A0ABR0T5I9_AURPU
MGDRTALVVVDVQDGIANATDGVPDAEQIKGAIGHILNLARQHNQNNTDGLDTGQDIEILFIQHDDKDPNDPLHRGKPTWNLVYPPHDGNKTESLISKSVGDMFTSNPDLASALLSKGVANLVFVGLQTDFCVRASILGAITAGFTASRITLLRGAHSTFDNTTEGKSYTQVKEDVEAQLAELGVCLQDWRDFDFA